MNRVYLNGEFVERDAATISAFDRGLLYGDGLFETVRAYGGVPFALNEHLDRMAGSAAFLGILFPGKAVLVEAVGELIDRNGLADAYVRITLTRGEHTGTLVPDPSARPTLLVEARPLQPYPDALYRHGADVVISAHRHESSSPIRAHKTANYLPNILAKQEAAERGALEVVLLDPAGIVCECATSNLFCVIDGVLHTPPLDLNILPGITRRTVMGLARKAGVDVREERFTADILRSASEVFLTNSLMELLPVRSIAEAGQFAVPAEICNALHGAYRELVRSAVGAEG